MNETQPDSNAWSTYLTPSARLRSLGVICLGVGFQEGVLPAVRNRTLNHHAAVFVDKGSGWLTTSEDKLLVPSGSLFWLFPDLQHSYGPTESGWSEWWVLFDGPGTSQYEGMGLMSRTSPVVPIADRDGMLRTFSKMRRARSLPAPILDAALSAAVHQLVIESHVEDGDVGHTRPARILEQLRRDASTSMSVAEHAQLLGLSVDQLREIVRSTTGVSVKAYIVTARINRAKALLAGSGLPVVRVAARTGYDDAAYFTRIFTRHVGMSPSRFREQYLRGPGS